MASNLSSYEKCRLLDISLDVAGNGQYIALYTSDPTDADAGTEIEINPATTLYARQLCAFDAAVDGVSANTADIVFPVAGTNWGSITHIGIRDAATGGNLLWHGAATSAKLIESGDQYKILAGNLDVSLDAS